MSKQKTSAHPVADMMNEQRDLAADSLGSISDAVEYHAAMASDTVKKFGRRATDKIDSAADYVREADPVEMVEDATRVVRSISVPVAIAVGVVAVACLTAYLVRRA